MLGEQIRRDLFFRGFNWRVDDELPDFVPTGTSTIIETTNDTFDLARFNRVEVEEEILFLFFSGMRRRVGSFGDGVLEIGRRKL